MVSLSLCSFSSGFGGAVRLLSSLSASGSLSVSVCPYGSGEAFVSFEPLPAVEAVWPAVCALAFRASDPGYGGSFEFVADWGTGLDNPRAQALAALLESIGV